MTEPTARPVRRRSGTEIRRLILESARALFSERGYGATTTRAIADAAGVSEPLIFRNFVTKALLFQAAVADPMEELFSDYLEVWQSREPTTEDATQRMHLYVESLYDHLREHKPLLRALILSTQSNDPELAQLLHRRESPIIHYLDEIARLGKSSLPEVGWTGINASIAVRITFGFILSLAVFDELFFPEGKQPGRRALVDEMAAYVTHGLAHRPGRD